MWMKKTVLIQIIEQTHICSDFGEMCNSHFNASNGVKLLSMSFPEILVIENNLVTFYVRGDKKSKNDKIVW